MIVIHYTGSNNLDGTLSWFADPQSRVSSHFVVGKLASHDGDFARVVQIVPLEHKSYHAGASQWLVDDDLYELTKLNGMRWNLPLREKKRLVTNVNSCSVGIELVGTGDLFPELQMRTTANLVRRLMTDNPWIRRSAVVGHDQVAIPPGRKDDPGPSFDWGLLWSLVDDIALPMFSRVSHVTPVPIAPVEPEWMEAGIEPLRARSLAWWRSISARFQKLGIG
jgi:N-acetylmuramoyl-L-alanine amidase